MEGNGFVRKSDMVRAAVREGDYKKALGIAKGFRLGISKEQSDGMVRAFECMTNPRFYISIGIDTERAIESGVEILNALYGS